MKKKILLCLFFVILFLLILNYKVYGKILNLNDGTSYDINLDPTKISEEYKYIIFECNKESYPDFLSIACFKIEPRFVNNYLVCAGSHYYARYYFDSGEILYWKLIEYDDSYSWNFASLENAKKYIYSSFDIKDENDNIIINNSFNKIDLILNVNPIEDTKIVPVVISTNFYDLDIFQDILVQYNYTSSGSAIDTWETCLWGRVTDSSSPNDGQYNFYINAYRNGTYHFRLVNLETMEYIYKDVVITNIVYSPDDVNNYVNGVFDPTPFLTYEYINDNKINIITQKFFIDQIIDLQCFYSKDISKEDYNNKEKWAKVEARTMVDQLTQQEVYQFCFEVDNNSFNADGTYTVCFYNVFLDKYTYSEIVINFDEILNVDGSMIWKYVHFFKERFGFLIYPFDLTINTLKRIAAINYSEPKFNIPDIYEPTTNKKLISAVTFNFNDYLENNNFKNVHNIYLIIVDAAIIFALLNLAWKKISGVFK